jgi:4,5-DOPA dioxygenase extradiol
MTARMPAIFFGHGNPMNAITENVFTRRWSDIGKLLPRPKAVLAISAHWSIPGTAVTAMKTPRTIHDFAGFPPELSRVSYPAPGDPELAARVKELLEPIPVDMDTRWGLDHGTWSVLCHVFPGADIPVVQLSIDERRPAEFHFDLGRRLAPLREEGTIIVGSGNLVHNLEAYAWGRHPAEPFDWALRFDARARQLVLAGEEASLVAYESLGRDALLSIPTPEHFLPLLYVLGTRSETDEVRFPVEGIEGGSISMLAVELG